MRIRDFMSTPTMTISPTASVIEARDLMRQRQVRHLPVLNSERVVGIVTDRDIRTVLPSPATSLAAREITYLLAKLTVDEVMAHAVITVAPDTSVTEAIGHMLEHTIGALPVVEAQQVVGMLTRTDILRAFVRSQGGLPVAA